MSPLKDTSLSSTQNRTVVGLVLTKRCFQVTRRILNQGTIWLCPERKDIYGVSRHVRQTVHSFEPGTPTAPNGTHSLSHSRTWYRRTQSNVTSP